MISFFVIIIIFTTSNNYLLVQKTYTVSYRLSCIPEDKKVWTICFTTQQQPESDEMKNVHWETESTLKRGPPSSKPSQISATEGFPSVKEQNFIRKTLRLFKITLCSSASSATTNQNVSPHHTKSLIQKGLRTYRSVVPASRLEISAQLHMQEANSTFFSEQLETDVVVCLGWKMKAANVNFSASCTLMDIF